MILIRNQNKTFKQFIILYQPLRGRGKTEGKGERGREREKDFLEALNSEISLLQEFLRRCTSPVTFH